MKLTKQPVSLEVSDIKVEPRILTTRHSSLLPNTIRSIICGPSNCGKTNVMISLILHKNGLKFRNVYLYSKTTFQAKYRFLAKIFENIPSVSFKMFNENKDVISPDKVLPDSIFIFDDVACENQEHIRNYYCMGRHKRVDCFYLSQTYSKIPKQLIRDNVNFLLIFKQDDINMKHIYDEHVNSDMGWVDFKKLCCKIWKDPYSFLLINKDCEINNGRYRKGFDVFISF